MTKTPKPIALIAAALGLAACASPMLAQAAATVPAMKTIQLMPGPGPVDNPLKGWCPWAVNVPIHQPYSMVYCDASWKQLEPTEGQYDFADWEASKWNSPHGVGKHVVLRVWADYPNSPTGVPDWLLAKGVKMTAYNDPGIGAGQSPDYDNPAMISAMEGLIAAMGKRYDHDPRVAFIELGLLGHWGEWHTYPHPELFASDATQQRIVDAYHAAFPDKILEVRNANGYQGTQAWIGYHDDLFPQDTDGAESWKFLPTLRAGGRDKNWKVAVIGGEMDPGNAKNWLGPNYATLQQTIASAHFTWAGPYCPAQDDNTSPEFIARSQDAVREMGYQYTLKSVTFAPAVKKGQPLQLSLDGLNQGVAPFYYPWPVQLALISMDHHIAQIIPVPADIRAWEPGTFHLAVNAAAQVKPGRYGVALGIIDPYTQKPAVAFANTLPTFQGWTVVSHITVMP